MWVLLLEAAVALSLLLIIVWATWPKKDHARIEAPKPPEAPHDGQP